MLKYKGYVGTASIDLESEILHGIVSCKNDVITFQAKTIPELKQAFKDSVDDYLEFCKERNREPQPGE